MLRTLKSLLCTFAFFSVFLSIMAFGSQPKKTPDTVHIETYASTEKKQTINEGMGFVFEQDGFILTAYDVLLNPKNGTLLPVIDVNILRTGQRYAAEIVGVEPTINLAIIKIFSGETLETPQLVTMEDLDAMPMGKEIWAVSDQKQSASSLLSGRLAGRNSRECYQESMTSTMLRAEMPLGPKLKGTPIFDASGQVIAMYTGYRSPEKLGHIDNEDEIHILPITLATNIYQSLKYKKNMLSPWTGFSVIRLNEQQKSHFPTKHGDQGGIAIEYVWENSPAQNLGLLPGDILVRFGHYRIESPADFQKWLYMHGVGHPVKMMFVRNDEYLVKNYTIEERPTWAIPK